MMRGRRRGSTTILATIWRSALSVSFLLFGVACGSGGDGASSTTGATGSDGASSAAGATGSDGAGGGSDTSASSSGGAGGSSNGSGDGGSAGSAGMGTAGDGGFTETGVCGQRSEGTVTTSSFETYEEFYLLADEGFGDAICVVRFDVERVGDAPDGCDDFVGQAKECVWTHLVEYSNPRVITDENGVCENSELMLDAGAISEIDGRQVAYGYVFEYQGHNNVLMSYNEERGIWEAGVNAGWDEDSGAFQFDRRDGFCGY